MVSTRIGDLCRAYHPGIHPGHSGPFSLATPLSEGAMGFGQCWGRNGEFCVAVGRTPKGSKVKWISSLVTDLMVYAQMFFFFCRKMEVWNLVSCWRSRGLGALFGHCCCFLFSSFCQPTENTDTTTSVKSHTAWNLTKEDPLRTHPNLGT